MHKTQQSMIFIALLGAAVTIFATAARAAEGDKVEERQLIAVLQSDAPEAEKAITCKRLAVHGSGDAVPALAALLPNEHLASWARIALEAIPDRAVDKALRDALTTLNGRQAIGVINSIGVRRDADAVDELSNRLTDSNADVASAAAVALGHIGSEPATTALRQALADSPAPVRSAVAEGCILCAEKLLADGKSDEAAQLYDQVRNADVPKPRILEATRGAIIARQTEGIPLMAELLESGDRALFRLGLTTSRELLGGEVTDALVTTLGKTTPERQALLMEAFADRDDIAALPAVLEAAGSGPVAVRVAALEGAQASGQCLLRPIAARDSSRGRRASGGSGKGSGSRDCPATM